MTHLSTQSLGNWHPRDHNGVVVMRMADLDPRRAAVAAAVCATLRRSRLSVRLCAMAACAFALAGCETLVTVPDAALLKPQPSPKCEARPEKAAGDGSSEATKLRRLDYEAQCYRHAEMIARARLGKLQASLRESEAKARARASKADTAANP
jgi:hypothetical protein